MGVTQESPRPVSSLAPCSKQPGAGAHGPGDEVVYQSELPLSGTLLVDLLGDVLARGLPFRFCANGASMFPFIRGGDVLTLGPLPEGGPRLGDVLAFRRQNGSSLVIHRAVWRKGQSCLLKGDNYRPGQSDGLIPNQDLLARVTRIERRSRVIHWGLGPERALIAFLSRFGLLFFAMRPAVWIYQLLRLVFHSKKIAPGA